MLETVFVEMDPVLDGFEGVLIELSFNSEEYRLALTAAGSGNRLLTFASEELSLVHQVIRLLLGQQIAALNRRASGSSVEEDDHQASGS